MKLLFDQNISFRIVNKIEDIFPDSKQVRELNLEGMSDKLIWEYAKRNQFLIVTFDSDFFDLSNLYGFPPKVVWLRIGNTTTKNIIDILKQKNEIIRSFFVDDQLACLEIE